MSELVRQINRFFRTAIKSDIEDLHEELLLSDRQEKIFRMYYIRRLDLDFIASELGVSSVVINKELKTIRKKLAKALDLM